jgi:aryl-alcohol dehydrogenase-like predicted oxidoreductase
VAEAIKDCRGDKSNLEALELTLSDEDLQVIDTYFPKPNEDMSLVKY